jgi:hypothetical protein
MTKLCQYYSNAVAMDQIQVFLMDRDLEDVVQVSQTNDHCYTFTSTKLNTDRLHDVLDMLCDYVLVKEAAE